MRIRLKIVLFQSLLLIVNGQMVRAQEADTLEAFTIIGSLQKKQISAKQKFELEAPTTDLSKQVLHTYQLQSLDKLLQNNSAVFIKNYGINNLSTLSIRGTSAAQSQVLWQGLPVNNAVSGYSDLSQLHTGLFDDVQLRYGINAALYGNGSIGGAVQLENHNAEPNYTHFKLGGGSFGQFDALAILERDVGSQAHFSVRASAHKAKHRIPLKYWQAENDFLENAQAEQAGIILGYSDQFFLFSNNQAAQLQIHSWLQYDYREIPPALFEKISTKNQNTTAWRNVLTLQQPVREKLVVEWRYGYQWQQYQYADSASFQYQNYTVQSHYAELSLSPARAFKSGDFSHNFYWLLPFQYHHLIQKSTLDPAAQMRLGIAGTYRLGYLDERVAAQIGIRQDQQKDTRIPLTVQAQLSGRILSYEDQRTTVNIPVYISWQNAVRLPTLNELFYFPGGNKNLLPEYSKNMEAGWRIEAMHEQPNYALRARLQSGWFSRQVENWIYWLGNSIWTPHNIAEVYSRGWDWKLQLNFIKSKFSIQNNTEFTYTIATTEQSLLAGSQSIGKQIPYTPRYLAQNNLSVHTSRWSLGINTQYTGYRFTNLDETAYLPPYWLWNAHILYNIHHKGKRLVQVQAQCFNLTNAKIESMPGRPMAPRQFVLSASISL